MHFNHSLLVELPYTLNVPAGNYDVSLPAGLQTLQIVHGLYAGSDSCFENGGNIAIASKESVRSAFPETKQLSLLQLRTVVNRSYERVLEPAALVSPNQGDLLDEITRNLISNRLSENAGDQLMAEAKVKLDGMDANEKAKLFQSCSLRLTARQLFPLALGDEFVQALNTFIRQYMVILQDFFVEELTLHQIASTNIGGVQITTICDGVVIDASRTVGKVPPIMRTPWFVHPSEKIELLKNNLRTQPITDAIALLGIRAKMLAERGAFRSAIIEAAAAMETSIARRLVAGLITQGHSHDGAVAHLHKTQRFSERCKTMFQSVIGKSLAAENNTLWNRVVTHRDKLRHKIVHSDEEPTEAETKKVIEDFIALAALAQTVSR